MKIESPDGGRNLWTVIHYMNGFNGVHKCYVRVAHTIVETVKCKTITRQ